MAKTPRDPFDVTISAEKRQAFGRWITDEIRAALDARSAQELETEYWWMLYEQARTRAAKNLPWPDAADLTSYIAAEKVDALHARMVRTVMTEPVWTVEGWGESASRAPFVEEFHAWKGEEERLQSMIDKWFLMGLVEPRALLEVSEGTETRRVRKEKMVALEIDPLTNFPIIGEDGTYKLLKDGEEFVEATDPNQPAANVIVDELEPVRTGPHYRILPYKDSLILPGHARDKDEIWGYAKRFWRRKPDLERKAKAGIYDKEIVERLTSADREQTQTLARANQTIAPQQGVTAEIELWEALVLYDFDGKGERWYLATVHLTHGVCLRLQHDNLERSRFVPLILFPRPDRATEGYSFVGHKLLTIQEEHTAWRNMIADRASMAANAPIKRMHGALWDPDEQPFGPKAVITVRDPREVEPMVIPDVPPSLVERERETLMAAERVAGINDIALGVQPGEARTLGERQMAFSQSAVRMDLVIKRAQEALEDLAQIRHAIWKRVLAEQGEADAPESLLVGLEARGVADLLPNRKITAQLLDGQFKFKPRGSVETADPDKLLAYYVQALQTIPALAQIFPGIMMAFQTPQAARAMLVEFVRLFRFQNRAAFLAGLAQPTMTPPGMGMMPPGVGMGMGMPGPPPMMPMAPPPAQVQ
jgi:hypothetical protein